MLDLAFEGRKNLVFWFFVFSAKFRPASGDPGLGFAAPFWAPGAVFTAQGDKQLKKPKNFESRAKHEKIQYCTEKKMQLEDSE